ncbi:hypothetical protein ACM26M_02815 [Kluyvera cryocrescens]|uniref:hypothetical protein n=1 Tax=Kluyvera cryocrescens TaxID=580 RepID=UPI0039F681D3
MNNANTITKEELKQAFVVFQNDYISPLADAIKAIYATEGAGIVPALRNAVSVFDGANQHLKQLVGLIVESTPYNEDSEILEMLSAAAFAITQASEEVQGIVAYLQSIQEASSDTQEAV